MITSISIVTYNSAAVIEKCLTEIDAETPIFIYDNASSDNTVELVRQNFPNVIVQKGEKNLWQGGEEGELQGACPYSGFKKEKNCDMKNNKSK